MNIIQRSNCAVEIRYFIRGDK